jgi:hypothetical protein
MLISKKITAKLKNFFLKIRIANSGDITFLFKSYFFRNINKLFCFYKSSSPFLSGDTYERFSSIVYKGESFLDLKEKDVISCPTDLLEHFINVILPGIKTPFIIITHRSDLGINKNHLQLLESKFLIHWFAQNNGFVHPKITTIPIGLEDAWRHNNGVVSDFHLLRQNQPEKKIPRILYGFTVHTNPLEREKALHSLKKSEVAVFFSGLSKSYRENLNRYMFVASPPGNGVDCHRTWEAFYLQTIPIVLKNDIYYTFENFPGIILNDWSELENLDERSLINLYSKAIKKLVKFDLIWDDYWRKKINAQLLLSEDRNLNDIKEI